MAWTPRKRRWLIAATVALALFACAYFFFGRIVDSKLRPVIEKQLTQAVGSPVAIQSVRAGLTGDVVLNYVYFTVPGDPWESQWSISQVAVNVALLDLLFQRKPLEQCLQSLLFIRPQVVLVKKSTAAATEGAAPVASAAVTDAKVPIPLIPVPKLFVRDGWLSVQGSKTPREILRRLDFSATAEKGATTWGLSLTAFSPEAKSKAAIRFNGSLRLEPFSMSGKVVLEKWPLASLNNTLKDLTGWELQAGTIDLESPVVFRLGQGFWFDAKTTLEAAAVRSPDPLGLIFNDIQGRVFIRPNELSIPSMASFKVGETLFSATGSIPFDDRPISVETMTDHLFLSSVFTEVLKTKNLQVSGTGHAVLSVKGTVKDPLVEASAELGASQVGKGKLDSLALKARYQNGVLSLIDAKGKLYGGKLTAEGFVPLTGDAAAPVSLKAVLNEMDTQKLAESLGISALEGRGEQEVRIGGTLEKPVISMTGRMNLTRKLRDEQVNYSVKNNIQLSGKKMEVSAVINEKNRLESVLTQQSDGWTIQKIIMAVGGKTLNFKAKGIWPKDDETPMDLVFQGKGLLLKDMPFFPEQFPDVSGQVDVETHVTGTRRELRASLQASSREIRVGNLEPQPMRVSMDWKPAGLHFEDLTVGEILSVKGDLGLKPDAPSDLKIRAQGVPINLLAEMGAWNSPPRPFEGRVTGKIRLSGLPKRTVMEADGSVENLRVGDWSADKTEAVMNLDQGRLQIQKLRLIQADRFLAVSGWWDTRADPGTMSLKFTSKDFQLGKGPYLSGDFLWDAKTGSPWWKNWKGTFSSEFFSLKDLKNKRYQFKNFSMASSCDDLVLKGKLLFGQTISGSATWDASRSPSRIQALLKIAPVEISQFSELTQFLPASLKISGQVSGQLRLKNGTLHELPMDGSLQVAKGKLSNYDFSSMEITFDGKKTNISPHFTIIREEAKYELTGTLESPGVFWSPDAKVSLAGPFKKERLSNLVSLMGFDIKKERISGQVDGDLTMGGTLVNPIIKLSAIGRNLRFDDNLVPSAELNLTVSGKKILFGKNRVSLMKGEIEVDHGNLSLDTQDPSVVLLDIAGNTQGVPIAVMKLSSRIRLNGRLALEEKAGRPTFDGLISILETGKDPKNPSPFDLAIRVQRKVVELRPLNNTKTQLVGQMDLSQENKITFRNLHLENSPGQFSVDGTLDLAGESRLVSDAKDIPIEAIGKWFFPRFPLSGIGNYHLVFEGSPDNPVFNCSINVSQGKIGDLQFDLLDGNFKSRDNMLFLGSVETPISLSRKGLFAFTVDGKMPLALNKAGRQKVKNQEMDINAKMEKGDFSLILLARLAKKASGIMDFSAHVGGTLDDPMLNMDLSFSKCQMVPRMVAQSVEDMSGRIKVRENKLVVEDLNARIGQGRLFITSPPADQTQMVLEGFVPKFLDFRIRTVTDRGLWLNIPAIMKKGEWGEIHFYGSNPEEPFLIRGPLSEPRVIGTALLDSGHYTYPPVPAYNDYGEKIEYRELSDVFFELSLAAGKNAWYTNEFSSNYLELKIDPGAKILIKGKDSNKTPEEPGIKCSGTVGSHDGWLRYLGHQFKFVEGSLIIFPGSAPKMWGHGTDRLQGVGVISAGGVRTSDVDISCDFKGTFGDVKFSIYSIPPFHPNDKDASQKMLYSYIMFGQDLTGLTTGGSAQYTAEQLRTAYENKVGQVAGQAFLEWFDRISSTQLTTMVRPLGLSALGNTDVNIRSNVTRSILGQNPEANAGVSHALMDAGGNTLSGSSVPIVQVQFRKPIDQRLSVLTNMGLLNDQMTDKFNFQGQVGAEYSLTKNLTLEAITGQRDDSQLETKFGLRFNTQLPDIKTPKKDDKERPRFMRFDIYPISLGKFQLVWETDKVTKSELSVFDPDGKLFMAKSENNQHEYNHEMVVDGLNPELQYKIRISVKDLNGNETIKTVTTPAVNE